MNENLSQSSCEIISDIKNLEVVSETENLSSQCSEIAGELKSLEFKSQESSSSSESSSKPEEESTTAASASSSATDEPKKRKRKRKRHHKKKLTTTYEPPRPFTARYKKFKILEAAVLPKLHIRFDDDTGEPDKATSEFNLKPRIIEALKKNLSILENLREISQVQLEAENPTKVETYEPLIISLKPRIIKAFVVT